MKCLKEPAALKEVHAWRRQLQKRAEKIGWENYLKELNAAPSVLKRKSSGVIRERRSKYGK